MGEKQELIPREAQRAMAGRSPFDEMEQMMDRMFARFVPETWGPGAGWGPGAWESDTRAPNVDVLEREEEILVRAELPGVAKEDIEVSVTDSTLSLRATPRAAEGEEEGDYYRCEISAAPFERNVRLPTEVDGEKASAVFRDGLLELRLPKAEHARRRAIRVE